MNNVLHNLFTMYQKHHQSPVSHKTHFSPYFVYQFLLRYFESCESSFRIFKLQNFQNSWIAYFIAQYTHPVSEKHNQLVWIALWCLVCNHFRGLPADGFIKFNSRVEAFKLFCDFRSDYTMCPKNPFSFSIFWLQ